MSNTSAIIPQANPGANYRAHAEEIGEAISRVLQSGTYLSGREIKAFEQELGHFLQVSQVVAASSGTDALWLALTACDIGPGDEVITVAHTAVATVAAIDLCGATPVLVDIDPVTLTLEPGQLERALSPRTRAVVPVHLYGRSADLQPILSFCRTHNLRMIEDCAQAAGGFHGGARVGTVGDAAAFSFYPTKNLAALGDGGAAVTHSADLANRMRALREYGWKDARRLSERPGRNTRMDEIQAAVLRVKLSYLDEENRRRVRLAEQYTEALTHVPGLTLPVAHQPGAHVFHQYVVQTKQRDALAASLRGGGIGTAIHYPVPVHLQPAYRERDLTRSASAGALPNTEHAACEVLSLPMFPELGDSAVAQVTEAIRACLTQGK